MAKKATPKKPKLEALLNAYMAEHELSYRGFADKHGVPKSTLQAIANGTTETLSLENARILAPLLGRSVAELVGLDASEAGGSGDAGELNPALQMIPHNLIVQSDFNPRRAFDEEELSALAESIAVNGVLQNLVVRRVILKTSSMGGTALPLDPSSWRYQIVAGERRWRAARLLIEAKRLPNVYPMPVRIIDDSDANARALALLENLQRVELLPLDEADAFQALVTTCGWTTAQIAERIHKTQRFVQQRMALVTKLAPELRTALTDGTIKLDQARALTTAEPKQQLKMLKDIKISAYGLQTGDDIRRKLTQGKIPAARAIFPIDKYTGDTFVDDHGAVYFTDKKEFDKLQEAAVEDLRLDKLAEGFAFAAVEDYFVRSEFKDELATKKAKSGVVIEMTWQGGVTVHEYLVPEQGMKAYLALLEENEKEQEEEESETREERDARWAREREERKAEEDARTDYLAKINPRIRDEMESSPTLMLHYTLWNCQTDARHRKNAPPLLTWDEIAALSLEETAIRIARIELFSGFGDTEGPFGIHDGQNDGVRAVFAAINEPTPDWMEEERDEEDFEDDDEDEDADGGDDAAAGSGADDAENPAEDLGDTTEDAGGESDAEQAA